MKWHVGESGKSPGLNRSTDFKNYDRGAQSITPGIRSHILYPQPEDAPFRGDKVAAYNGDPEE
jgi:hypothetical protein